MSDLAMKAFGDMMASQRNLQEAMAGMKAAQEEFLKACGWTTGSGVHWLRPGAHADEESLFARDAVPISVSALLESSL